MKSLIKKNKQKRLNYAKYEIPNLIFRLIKKNAILDNKLKTNVENMKEEIINTNQAIRSSHISNIRNICVLTGRPRAVFLDNRLSRNQFKQLTEAGLIPGVKKQ